MGRGEKSLLCDPGSELYDFGGRERQKESAKKIKGMGKKKKEKEKRVRERRFAPELLEPAL